MNTTTSNFSLFTFHSLVCVSLILSSFSAHAQGVQTGIGPPVGSSAASYYYIAKPGELTMQVNIWGYVKNPGRYEISTSTDLVQLISLSGGPQEYSSLDDIEITRIVKSDVSTSSKTFTVDLAKLDKVDQRLLQLYPGDTIIVDHTAWLTLRDVFAVTTTVGVLASLALQIISLSR